MAELPQPQAQGPEAEARGAFNKLLERLSLRVLLLLPWALEAQVERQAAITLGRTAQAHLLTELPQAVEAAEVVIRQTAVTADRVEGAAERLLLVLVPVDKEITAELAVLTSELYQPEAEVEQEP